MFDTKLTRNLTDLRVLLLLGFLALFAASGMQLSLAGAEEVWTGKVNDPEQGLVAAELTIDSGKYFLHYGSPRSCRLEGEEVFADDKRIILRFNDSSGGQFCDRLYQGQMTIEKNDPKEWAARVEKKAIGFVEDYSLQKKPVSDGG